MVSMEDWKVDDLFDVIRQAAPFPIVVCIRYFWQAQIRGRDTPSPFASSLMFGYVGNFIYDLDAPLAERRAQALSVDPSQAARAVGRIGTSGAAGSGDHLASGIAVAISGFRSSCQTCRRIAGSAASYRRSFANGNPGQILTWFEYCRRLAGFAGRATANRSDSGCRRVQMDRCRRCRTLPRCARDTSRDGTAGSISIARAGCVVAVACAIRAHTQSVYFR